MQLTTRARVSRTSTGSVRVHTALAMASWGGPREGAGRKRKTTNKAEKQQRLRISEGLYHRWTELKNLRRSKNDEEVFSYLLDLAREVDQGSVTRYWQSPRE